MEKACVWIEDIAEAFEDMDMNWKPYLDTNSGQVIFVPLNPEQLEEYTEEEKEEFSKMAELSRYLPLPEQKELREFDIMEQYTQDTANTGFQKRLFFALNKPKPFRNFRVQIRLLGLEEDYSHYRYMIFCAKARTWCKQNDIPYDIDTDEVKEYIQEIEEDERIQQDLEDFNDELDEFEYDDDDYEDYFEE